MSQARHNAPFPTGRVILWAILGGLVALLLGLAGVALAPDEGFADLALASMTRIFFVPLGVVIGGVIGWRTAKAR
jgi:hypothetical protein